MIVHHGRQHTSLVSTLLDCFSVTLCLLVWSLRSRYLLLFYILYVFTTHLYLFIKQCNILLPNALSPINQKILSFQQVMSRIEYANQSSAIKLIEIITNWLQFKSPSCFRSTRRTDMSANGQLRTESHLSQPHESRK